MGTTQKRYSAAMARLPGHGSRQYLIWSLSTPAFNERQAFSNIQTIAAATSQGPNGSGSLARRFPMTRSVP